MKNNFDIYHFLLKELCHVLLFFPTHKPAIESWLRYVEEEVDALKTYCFSEQP